MRDMEMLFRSGEIDKKLRVRAMLIELIADLYKESFQKNELSPEDERARAFSVSLKLIMSKIL